MIKTKENSIKQVTVKDKIFDTSNINRIKQKETQNKQESIDGSKQAVNEIENTQKATAFEATRRSRNFVVKRTHDKKRAKMIKQRNVLSSDLPATDNVNHSSFLLDNFSKNMRKDKRLRNRIFSSRSIKSERMTNRVINQTAYMNRAKALAISKYQKKVQRSYEEVGKLRSGVNIASNVFSKTFSAIKTATTSVTNLISIGSGLLLMVIIVLFIGLFACLSDDSTVNSATEPLSSEVIEYREAISKYAKDYDMEEYVSLIQAIMMNESEGKGSDPMNASLLEYNTKYPKKINGIKSTDYSIEVGIHYLSDCFKLAEVKGPYDMDNISLMLQGYNYGKEYINWAKEHFNGYTRANAKVYSDEKRAELQVDTFGDPKYVSHVLRYYHLGNGDIVMVAKTQVGNVGGKPYWSWYGFNERVEWCACFISWVANESKQLNISIPKFSAVSDGIKWFKERNQFENKSYTPKAGDLIFFDWEQDGKSDHVGIVEKVENGKLYTIEGNSSDECREKSYQLNSAVIFGYGNVINKWK